MQIKRFEAKNMTEALRLIKNELGPEAVILSARSLRKESGILGALKKNGVEVTAATDNSLYQSKGKKVLIRCDFNVPLDEYQQITDDRRIRASLPTIKKAVQEGASIILCSHLGRPKGQAKPEFSLKPVADYLSKLIGKEIKMAADCVGPDVEEMVENLQQGEILLLENLRFHNAETGKDQI